MVFPFAAFGCFNFDPREFSIDSIHNTERERCEDSYADATKRKSGSRRATNDKTCNRNLVWRNPRFAKERDYRGFDRGMDVSREIQSALLRGIENNALSEMTFPCVRRCKTEWPHMPPHGHDVIVNLGRI